MGRSPSPPRTPREERATRAVEGLLAAGVVVSLGLAALSRASPAWEAASAWGPPLASLPVDVAHDPPARLRLLPGIGPTRAEAIVQERERSGPVTSLRDLERVKGIGKKTLEGLGAAGAVVARDDRPP